MINIIKSIIHFKSFTLMIKRKKNKQINNSFSRNNEGPKQHTLVTIRGGGVGGAEEKRIRRNKVLMIRGLRSSST